MKMGTVVRESLCNSQSELEALSRYGFATVREAMRPTGLRKHYMRPINPGERIAGNAVIVLGHPEDNWMLHVAAELCQPTYWLSPSPPTVPTACGELLATSMNARGVLGLIIDASCRDVAELTMMRLPIWSRVISAKGTIKATLDNVYTPVICSGALVHAGDAIVADDDGVVIVPHDAVVKRSPPQRSEFKKRKRNRRVLLRAN